MHQIDRLSNEVKQEIRNLVALGVPRTIVSRRYDLPPNYVSIITKGVQPEYDTMISLVKEYTQLANEAY